MFKKLLILFLALTLCVGTLAFTTLAAEGDEDGDLILIFEENFEEYEAGVNVSSTTMPDFFVADYNSIGDGLISVQEATSGNLYLKSHVFTQIYSATPIVGAYDFSLDIIEAQGNVQTGVFIRAPKTAAAYYEADGYPDTSTSQAGLLIYTRADQLGVNVKTYDANAGSTAHLKNNTQVFSLPDGVTRPYRLRVTDSGEEIAIYVSDTLICRITYADPGQTYSNHESEGKFFGTATLYDAAGTEMATYQNPLMSSDGSYVGWTTRAADMSVDNIRVLVNKSHQAVLAINQLPSKVTEKNLDDAKELAAAARALYDALSEDQKELVINYGKLTKAETSISEMEAMTTEAPTDPVTEPVTDPVTEPATIPATDAVTEPTTVEPGTQAPAVETDPVSETDTTEPEVKVIDDSRAIWILIAVMIVAVCGAAGFITVKVRK